MHKLQERLLALLERADVSKRELRDAARLAVQSAAAAAATFLVMRSLGMAETFVGVLSAVFVVQPSVGNTLGEARQRVVATAVGSLIGIACLLALPRGYGTAVALALSMLLMNAVAGFRSEWRYGVVAAVALALGAESDWMDTAKARGLAIGLGAALGAVTALVVWPDSAAKRARRHLRTALRACADRLEGAVDGMQGNGRGRGDEARRRFHTNLESARKAAEAVALGDDDALGEKIERTERLYNSALFLDRVAEESDRIGAGDDGGFGEQIGLVRERACDVIRGLADGDEGHGGALDDIEEALEEARRIVNGGAEDSREHVLENAVIFGLGEVHDSLCDLVEAFGEDGAERSVPAELVAKVKEAV